MACAWVCTSDTDNNVMNIIWSYGGKLVEADNKTVARTHRAPSQAVQFIADMYHKHKIIPKGAIAWDNTGNNKAYQSRQVIFVLNPTSIYAHLAESDKELYNVTGLLPVPAGPAGAFEELGTTDWVLFKHNPYPEVAKGLAEYWMAPENLRVMIEEGDGRWGPPYKGMYDSDFWKRPVFQHWRGMLERGRQFASPGTRIPPRRGVATYVHWPHDAPGAGGELGGREGGRGGAQEGRGDLCPASGGVGGAVTDSLTCSSALPPVSMFLSSSAGQ